MTATTDSRNAYRATRIPTSQPDSNEGAIWIQTIGGTYDN